MGRPGGRLGVPKTLKCYGLARLLVERDLWDGQWFATHDAAALVGLADYVHRHAEMLDAIVVTGDLSTSARDEDLSLAAAYFVRGVSADPPWEQVLADVTVPVGLIPGNHDRIGGSYWLPRLCKRFDRYFHGQWSGAQGAAEILQIPQSDPRIVVLGADFSRRSTLDMQLCRFGSGRVHDDVLESLSDQTLSAKRRYPRALVLWLTHFTPATLLFSGSHKTPKHLILDRDARVLEAARACGVHSILSGHGHKHGILRHPCGVRVLTAGTASQSDPRYRNWAHLLEFRFTQNGSLVSCQRVDILRNGDEWRTHGKPTVVA